ncbi:MAG: hypothetical protein GXP33_08870 [Spirochaetes bacterium]|nr:hypothetical protein [Spirochaetota bacterium]
MNRTTFSIILFLITYNLSIFADEYSQYFSSFITRGTFNELIKKHEIMNSFGKDPAINIISDSKIKNLITNDLKELKPTIGVELIKILQMDNIDTHSEKTFLLIYNILHSISTLKGINYFSVTRRKERILFYDSYVIDSPDKENRVKDPFFKKILTDNKLYIFQHDSTLGKNIYLVKYFSNKDRIIMRTENITMIKYLFVPLINKHKLINYFIIIPGSRSILFYGASFAQFNSIIPVSGKRADSFYNRLKAMYSWFVKMLKDKTKTIHALKQTPY